MQLRPYQLEAIRALWEFWRNNPRGTPLIVCPTGGGKSLILSEIARRVLEKRPQYKIVVVTHRKELIEQNAAELSKLLAIPIGIYSAGLGSKTVRNVTVAGIQSIYKKTIEADLIIVDEVHLVSRDADSMYQKFFASIPTARVVGLTATPYRMDQGSLVGNLFSGIAYDINVASLVPEYLSPLVSVPSKNTPDFSRVAKSGFDYKQSELEAVFDPLIQQNCEEVLSRIGDRKSVLVFCSGIEHAKKTSEAFKALGQSSDYVTGEMLNIVRDANIARFKAGQIRILCNCDILTTGFNHPGIDCIVLLRATRSTGLYVQICGRGMRKSEGKVNCLVLDFGGNIERHGPIDCIEIKTKNGKDKAEITKLPVKTCPDCDAVWHIKTLFCTCGHVFSRESMIAVVPSTAKIMSEVETLTVDQMKIVRHKKDGKPDSLRIDFVCGARVVSEFLCFEHGGYAAEKARHRWRALGGNARTVSEALYGEHMEPRQIEVVKDGKWDRVRRFLDLRKKEDTGTELFKTTGINI